ncbi:MAG: EAL domain-containing protein [Burkholderiales bacterium]|nr:EAL domain-containing protein [Burkholderiales bacterium]
MSHAPVRLQPPSQTPPGESAVYLRAITEDILGWSDPGKRLREALAGDDFLLFAQRIRPLKIGIEPDCCEILLRLREEEDHMLPPGGFFPVAEALDMLEDIDRWVVARALAWRAPFAYAAAEGFCSINLSTDSICNPSFAGYVRSRVGAAGFPGRQICFEITESDTLTHPAAARAFITTLKPLGCRFAMDNFGSVKVSFAHLKDLPVDFLKIDGSIVQNILKNPGDLARARAISLTCQRLGVRTIAGNVESPEVLAKLQEIGFDYAQGFGIAQPCQIGDLAAFERKS